MSLPPGTGWNLHAGQIEMSSLERTALFGATRISLPIVGSITCGCIAKLCDLQPLTESLGLPMAPVNMGALSLAISVPSVCGCLYALRAKIIQDSLRRFGHHMASHASIPALVVYVNGKVSYLARPMIREFWKAGKPPTELTIWGNRRRMEDRDEVFEFLDVDRKLLRTAIESIRAGGEERPRVFVIASSACSGQSLSVIRAEVSELGGDPRTFAVEKRPCCRHQIDNFLCIISERKVVPYEPTELVFV